MGLVATAAVVLTGLPAQAEDFVTLPWTRGVPGSSHQVWTFDDNTATNDPADTDNNPYGSPTMTITDGTYVPTFGGRSGLWQMVGSIPFPDMDFTIPAYASSNPIEVYIQVTYYNADFYFPTASSGLSSTAYESGPSSDVPGDTDWTVDVYSGTSLTSPSEFFPGVGVNSGHTLYIDEIIIDAYAIPEPASLILLGLGSITLLRRRR